MQFLVDTLTDDPAELIDVAAIMIRAARQRMPDDTAGAVVPQLAPRKPETLAVVATATDDLVAELDPAQAFAGGIDPAQAFGKTSLPADAIATDLPASFTPGVTGQAAPVAPAAIAPTTGTTPTATGPSASTTDAAASDAEDKDGYRWDKRIHSESKALNKDNTWRLKRGVSPELVAQVKAEQRANETPVSVPAGTMPAESPALPPASVSPVSPVVPPPPVNVPQVPAVPAATTPPPPPAAASGLPQGYQVGVEITDFKSLMAFKATPAMQAGVMKSTDLVEICKQLGLAGLHDLVPTHAKIPEVAAAIDKRLGVA